VVQVIFYYRVNFLESCVMKSKLRSSLIGLSALALVLTGTLHAPSQAAKKLPDNVYHEFKLNTSSNARLTTTQLAAFRKKLNSYSHLTGITCTVRHARNISSANLQKVTTSATAACSTARKQTKNLKFDDLNVYDDRRVTGTNYTLEVTIHSPRTVSFSYAAGVDTSLPKESKILKLNEKFKLPAGPATVVPGGSFVGWNTDADGRGTDYQAGQTIKVKHAIQLHPKYVGYTINFNIVSLDSNYGSHYRLLYYAPGDDNYKRPLFSDSQPAYVSTANNKVTIYLPGAIFDTAGFTVTNGLSVALTGGGSCPDILAVDNQCTVFEVTYTTNGTVTFDYEGSLP
jgi:hypothetical protein